MRALMPLAASVLLAALPVGPVALASPAAAEGTSQAVRALREDAAPKEFTIEDPRITESSGLAASRQHPGIYWTHNDSADGPYLYAVDSRTGRTVATVTMTGVGRPRDVEAIALGPDNTLYVGDIGDNAGGSWSHVWVYRLPEPKQLRDQTVRATQYTVTYADGPRNAEAMVVHPTTGRVYIVEKDEDGGHLYEGPDRLSPAGTNVFRSIAPIDLWATDAAFSPDGSRLAVRGYFGGVLYDWRSGRPKRNAMLHVPMQDQGESVTFTPDGSWLMYGSEGAQSTVEPGALPGAAAGGASREPAKGGTGGTDDDTQQASYGKGALVLLIALAVVYGGKRVVSRKK